MKIRLLPFAICALLFVGCGSVTTEDGIGQAIRDEAIVVALSDYIRRAPTEEDAKDGRFYVAVDSVNPAKNLFQQLKREFPNLVSRQEFIALYGDSDHTWGWFAAEVRSISSRQAVIITWSSRSYDMQTYFLKRERGSWTIFDTSRYIPG